MREAMEKQAKKQAKKFLEVKLNEIKRSYKQSNRTSKHRNPILRSTHSSAGRF